MTRTVNARPRTRIRLVLACDARLAVPTGLPTIARQAITIRDGITPRRSVRVCRACLTCALGCLSCRRRVCTCNTVRAHRIPTLRLVLACDARLAVPTGLPTIARQAITIRDGITPRRSVRVCRACLTCALGCLSCRRRVCTCNTVRAHRIPTLRLVLACDARLAVPTGLPTIARQAITIRDGITPRRSVRVCRACLTCALGCLSCRRRVCTCNTVRAHRIPTLRLVLACDARLAVPTGLPTIARQAITIRDGITPRRSVRVCRACLTCALGCLSCRRRVCTCNTVRAHRIPTLRLVLTCDARLAVPTGLPTIARQANAIRDGITPRRSVRVCRACLTCALGCLSCRRRVCTCNTVRAHRIPTLRLVLACDARLAVPTGLPTIARQAITIRDGITPRRSVRVCRACLTCALGCLSCRRRVCTCNTVRAHRIPTLRLVLACDTLLTCAALAFSETRVANAIRDGITPLGSVRVCRACLACVLGDLPRCLQGNKCICMSGRVEKDMDCVVCRSRY
jgi:hypothetical protein